MNAGKGGKVTLLFVPSASRRSAIMAWRLRPRVQVIFASLSFAAIFLSLIQSFSLMVSSRWFHTALVVALLKTICGTIWAVFWQVGHYFDAVVKINVRYHRVAANAS